MTNAIKGFLIFLGLGLLFSFNHLLADNNETVVVTGKVFAFKDSPLKNIQVIAKKSKSKVLTDSLGEFTIVCGANDRLSFTGQGFQTTYKKVNSNQKMDVKMLFRGSRKNEQIAIGNGHMSKKDLTHAVQNFKNYNTRYSVYPDIYALIQQEFTGVRIINTNGSKRVIVRGNTSLQLSNTALYEVDGVITRDISYIHPMMVSSVSLLKSGTGYGSRGSNGVVIIKTRKR